MHPALTITLGALAAVGTVQAARDLYLESKTMNGTSWLLLLVAVVAGYLAGRLIPQPARMLGLP